MPPFSPQPKPESRLRDRIAEKREAEQRERAFKMAVWLRDMAKCRCCERKVRKTAERVPDRGEVHHIHGRLGLLRYDVRCAILLCCEDHERITGKVNERIWINPDKCHVYRPMRGGPIYIDGSRTLVFEKIV